MAIKTRYIVSIIALAILLGSFIGYTIAQSSNTFYITKGVYPSSFDYTICKEDSIYYAKNKYGYISYSNSIFALLMQDVIDNLNSQDGGGIFIESGQYDATTVIYVSSNIMISGEGKTTNIHQAIEDGFGAIFFIGWKIEEEWETCPLTTNVIIENLFIDSICNVSNRGNAISFLAVDNVIIRNILMNNINQGFETHGRSSNVFVSDINICNSSTCAFSFQPSIGEWYEIHDIFVSNIIIINANTENLGNAGVWINGWNIIIDKVSLFNTVYEFGFRVPRIDIVISNTFVNNTETSGFYVYPVVLDVQNSTRITFKNCRAFKYGRKWVLV